MRLARVTGTVVSTMKDASLTGQRLLLIQPLTFDGKVDGVPLVATDTVNTGAAETVMFVRGKEAAFAHLPDGVASDAAIIGVVEAQHLPLP